MAIKHINIHEGGFIIFKKKGVGILESEYDRSNPSLLWFTVYIEVLEAINNIKSEDDLIKLKEFANYSLEWFNLTENQRKRILKPISKK